MLTWKVSGTIKRWQEIHPYGMGTAWESHAETYVNDIELLDEKWPRGFEKESLTEQEFKKAKATAWEEAPEYVEE